MNEQQYDEIMAKIDGLMDAKPNTPEEAELERLSVLVEEYEDEHYPISPPDPKPMKDPNEMSYIAREPCGCIVAATLDNGRPRNRSLLKEWIDDGLTIERVTSHEVRRVGLALCEEHEGDDR